MRGATNYIDTIWTGDQMLKAYTVQIKEHPSSSQAVERH
jgi:hypothetical protein